jgi:hypothetical protein
MDRDLKSSIEPSSGAPHLFILGAGASKAALPNGDRNGYQIPLLDDLAEVLGLENLLKEHGANGFESNFEAFYSDLYEANPDDPLLSQLEDNVRSYFARLELPPEPTIYDYLILSLREKDFIATFNWDPFLLEAATRNAHVATLPRMAFLHGGATLGICDEDYIKGPMPGRCSKCKEPLRPSRLLFPVKNKDYDVDSHISGEWSSLQAAMNRAYIVTIFGFGAPDTDAKAVSLMQDAWSEAGQRDIEEIEIIDIKPRDELRERWKPFIVRSHYQVTDDFFNSMVARFPRRSCEAFFSRTMLLQLSAEIRPPRSVRMAELQAWFRPLIEDEKQHSA